MGRFLANQLMECSGQKVNEVRKGTKVRIYSKEKRCCAILVLPVTGIGINCSSWTLYRHNQYSTNSIKRLCYLG